MTDLGVAIGNKAIPGRKCDWTRGRRTSAPNREKSRRVLFDRDNNLTVPKIRPSWAVTRRANRVVLFQPRATQTNCRSREDILRQRQKKRTPCRLPIQQA